MKWMIQEQYGVATSGTWHTPDNSFLPQLRFSRPFRPVLLLTRYRELRRILETLTDMLNELIKLTFVIICFVLFFAWLGVVSVFFVFCVFCSLSGGNPEKCCFCFTEQSYWRSLFFHNMYIISNTKKLFIKTKSCLLNNHTVVLRLTSILQCIQCIFGHNKK